MGLNVRVTAQAIESKLDRIAVALEAIATALTALTVTPGGDIDDSLGDQLIAVKNQLQTSSDALASSVETNKP